MLLIVRSNEYRHRVDRWIEPPQRANSLCAVCGLVQRDDDARYVGIRLAHEDLQHLRPRRVAKKDGQAELACLGNSVWIHIESLVAHLGREWRHGCQVEHRARRRKVRLFCNGRASP